MATKPPLHVIRGTPAPDTPAERVRRRVRKHTKPEHMLACPTCGGREVIESKIGALRRDGKVTGGTKQILCAGCMVRGKRTVIL